MNQHSSEYDYLDLPEFKGQFCKDSSNQEMTFFVEGVKCSRCLWKIENIKNENQSIQNIQLDMGKNLAKVQLQPGGSFSKIAQTLNQMGFTPHPIPAEDSGLKLQELQNRKSLIQIGVAAFCTGNIMLLAISLYGGVSGDFEKAFQWLSLFLFLPIFFYSAIPFYISAWKALKQKRPSIDLPIVVALLIGSFLSFYHLLNTQGDIYFDSLSMLVFLLLSARHFLSRIQQNYLSPSYLKSFLENQVARVISPEGDVKKTPPSLIKRGEILLVYKGEKIPADGKLLDKSGFFNTAILTGESYPQKVNRGELCYSGTKLLSGQAKIEVTASAESSRLGKILSQVEKEVLTKTPLISFTDRLAQYFTFTILFIGFSFFAFYSFIDIEEAIRRSLALVILACPCALALATPLAQSLSLIRAAKNSILIKKADALERLSHIQNIIFDKTGTLSKGDFQLIKWWPHEPPEIIKDIVFALENPSEHPIAKALKEICAYNNSQTLEVKNWKEQIGKGVSGSIDGAFYEIKTAETQEEGYTTIGLYKDNQIIYRAILGDTPHEAATEVIQSLKSNNYSIYLISGDRKEAVIPFARKVGIPNENILFETSPEGKQVFIQKKPNSLMVGDGANDLLAFTGSHVSLAVHGSMESSLRVADIYLTNPDLKMISKVLRFSKDTLFVIKRNLLFSLLYNSIGGIAALLGYINPLVAAILMPLSSVIVVSLSFWGTSFIRNFSRETQL